MANYRLLYSMDLFTATAALFSFGSMEWSEKKLMPAPKRRRMYDNPD